MGEMRHQHIQVPLAAAISPLAITPSTLMNEMRPDHNTICPTLCDKCVGSFTSHRVVWTVKGCETGPTVYSPYPRRHESLTIRGYNHKDSTFSSVILRPLVLVWPVSNLRPPAWQPDAQLTEPPVRGLQRDLQLAQWTNWKIGFCCSTMLLIWKVKLRRRHY